MNPSNMHLLPRNSAPFCGWLLTSFSWFDKEYLTFASICTLLTLPLPHCPLIYKPIEIFLRDRCMLVLVFFCIGNSKLYAKLRSCFFWMLCQLVFFPAHDVLINRVPDCLLFCLDPVENALKIQVKTGRQFSFVPCLLTSSKSANRLKWFCKCPSSVPVISATFRYFVIPVLFPSQVTNTSCSAFPNTYFRGLLQHLPAPDSP